MPAQPQPENATQDIVIEILPGQNRSLVFLKNEWYGIAEVEFQGAVQRVDTFGQGDRTRSIGSGTMREEK